MKINLSWNLYEFDIKTDANWLAWGSDWDLLPEFCRIRSQTLQKIGAKDQLTTPLHRAVRRCPTPTWHPISTSSHLPLWHNELAARLPSPVWASAWVFHFFKLAKIVWSQGKSWSSSISHGARSVVDSA